MKKVITIVLALIMYMGTNASTPFITKWDLSIAGSGATQITFGVSTTGIVNYTWLQLTGGSATGSGTFSGGTATITGLPAGATIRLSIDPTNFTAIKINAGSDRFRLLDVEQWGTVAWSSMQTAFYNCQNLNITATDLPNLTFVNKMDSTFASCYILNGPSNIGSWNTSAVTSMSGMFGGTSTFNQPIGNWNTSAVTDMSGMFGGTSTFNQPIGSWNTSAVTNMYGMFSGTSAFNQPIGSWNTANVTNMSWMFGFANAFNQPIDNWNTSAVTDMLYMFCHNNVFSQPIGSWNTSAVTDMYGMFVAATAFNKPIGSWNTSAVTNMGWMFSQAITFNQPINSWNTSAVINMGGMFNQATAFNQSLANWNLSSCSSVGVMFDTCGLDCANYSATLVGWSANSNTPNSLYLGATGLQYLTSAVAAHNNLTTTKGWLITGDTLIGSVCTLGVTEEEALTISLSPNPATTQLTIQQLNNSTIETIHIYNVLGEETVISHWSLVNSKSATIDVSGLNKGIYFIEVALIRGNNNQLIRKKFVKE